MLARVQLPDPRAILESYPHELSGGMAQRVTIAMALLAGPQMLIADEPTTGLDVVLQLAVLNLLRDLAISNQTGLVLISHDLSVIRNYTSEVAVMSQGQIVERGVTSEVFSAPTTAYTRELMAPLLDDIDADVSSPTDRSDL
jgi:ABC-type dipeptide/oligopeptide/nickel transport system ATPase component